MATVRCRSCGRVWEPAAADQPCPSCGSVDCEIALGPATGRRKWWPAAVALAVVGVGVMVWIATRPRPGEPPPRGTDDSADALYRQSETAARAGNYREALTLAEQAVQAAPESSLGYVRRARARYFLGDTEGALADCDEAIRRDPGQGLAYAYRAPVAWLRNPPAAGVRDGERAAELLPDSAEALTGLALARVRAGDPAGAVAAATRAIEKAPDDPEPYRARGLALAARGEAAANDFDAAVRLSGDRPFYLVARANSRIRSVAFHPKPDAEVLRRADDDIDRALRADPASAVAHLAAANLQAVRERRADVLAACEKAVAANPRLVEAYLRAAEDLSPRQLQHFEMLQAALSQIIDLRELMGGDFAFGALFKDVHRLAAAGMKQDVPVRIVSDTFPPEKRDTLRDANINLSSLMDATGDQLLKAVTFKTILDVLCRQVGGSIRVTPEAIEVVGREAAAREAGQKSRGLSYDLIAPADLYRREERTQRSEEALRQAIDLDDIKAQDNSLGARLTDVQRLVSNKMKADITLYINYDSFQPKVRPMIRDTKVKRGPVLDPQGNAPAQVAVQAVLDHALGSLGEHVQVRPTPDFLEIVWTGPPAGWDAKWRPQRHLPKPRTEAIRWLTRGVEQVPQSGRLYRARGQVHLEQYELDAAIADLTRALELNPADKRAYRLRSLAYAARGNPGDAARARADALATKP